MVKLFKPMSLEAINNATNDLELVFNMFPELKDFMIRMPWGKTYIIKRENIYDQLMDINQAKFN